jgi:hypothetical protein
MGGNPGGRLMPSGALFDLLPDFGSRTPRPPQSPAAWPAASEPQHLPEPPPPQPDIGTIIAEAVADAEAALRKSLTEEHQAALEAERDAAAAEAKAFMRSFGGDVGTMIASRIGDMESRVSDLVCATVARIVGGLLSDDLQRRSLDALARTILSTVSDSEAVRISVHGPLSLFETLTDALGPRADNLDFVEAPGFDLTAVIDDAVFETRMSEWSAALSEVLA